MSLKVNLYRNNNSKSKTYGQVYARAKNSKAIDLDALAEHMADHDTPFSKGVISGVLKDMVRCIKELILLGQPVKIGDLCIFKAVLQSKGAVDVEHYDLGTHVKAVRLSCRATGCMTRKQLTEAKILEYTDLALAIKAGRAELPIKTNDDDDEGDGEGIRP